MGKNLLNYCRAEEQQRLFGILLGNATTYLTIIEYILERCTWNMLCENSAEQKKSIILSYNITGKVTREREPNSIYVESYELLERESSFGRKVTGKIFC